MSATSIARGLLVGLATFVVASPFGFVIFAFMGLMVYEPIGMPTATLFVAVIAGLAASWFIRLDRSQRRTDPGSVTSLNLLWGVIPAVASPFLLSAISPNVWLLAGVLVYTSISATALAMTRPAHAGSVRRDVIVSALWLGGSVMVAVAIVAIAAMFGLVGA